MVSSQSLSPKHYPRKRSTGDGKVLVRFRTIMSLTQVELAERLRVSVNTLARWERGEIAPPYMALMAAGYVYLQWFVPENGTGHIDEFYRQAMQKDRDATYSAMLEDQ